MIRFSGLQILPNFGRNINYFPKSYFGSHGQPITTEVINDLDRKATDIKTKRVENEAKITFPPAFTKDRDWLSYFQILPPAQQAAYLLRANGVSLENIADLLGFASPALMKNVLRFHVDARLQQWQQEGIPSDPRLKRRFFYAWVRNHLSREEILALFSQAALSPDEWRVAYATIVHNLLLPEIEILLGKKVHAINNLIMRAIRKLEPPLIQQGDWKAEWSLYNPTNEF